MLYASFFVSLAPSLIFRFIFIRKLRNFAFGSTPNYEKQLPKLCSSRLLLLRLLLFFSFFDRSWDRRTLSYYIREWHCSHWHFYCTHVNEFRQSLRRWMVIRFWACSPHTERVVLAKHLFCARSSCHRWECECECECEECDCDGMNEAPCVTCHDLALTVRNLYEEKYYLKVVAHGEEWHSTHCTVYCMPDVIHGDEIFTKL